ncbi:MAG: hypothetical protein NZ580_03460 [Bacteroidia bacterium]|nr:hypothetical protein [Bacteroidia bacterium]MDW8235865.1 hypothetical protein [Bacteroidia bacterium]
MRKSLILTFLPLVLLGQVPFSEEGYILPTRDTLYILVIFAEVDYGECGEDPHERQFGRTWPVGTDNHSQVPPSAPKLLDAFLTPGQQPEGILTYTYAEASFGQLVVLGDYLPQVVRVPCKDLPAGGTWSLYQEVELVARHLPATTFTTARGLPWQAFDRWQLLPERFGLPKLRTPSNPASDYQPRLDILFIVWRNLAYRLDIQKPPLPCNYGFGLWTCDWRQPFGPFTGGVECASSYTTCHGEATGMIVGFLVEFFHGLYGGNHWHTAGGAGWHTFPFMPSFPGLTAQGGHPLFAIGYDRWIMGWKHPQKQYLISALDEKGAEVPTDLSLPSTPQSLRVWLRDFMSTGDAVRIRLPYTEKGGASVKSQYLWLENHRFRSRSEVWKPPSTPCSDQPPLALQGFPGLYAYIQVGKDQKQSQSLHHAGTHLPNGLGSWIFPLSAEGNYDMEFRQTPQGWALDRAASLPNPFTGMNELYMGYDLNGDGKAHPSHEPPRIWEWRGDSACAAWYGAGDAEDAWDGEARTYLSLETNPAPVPVYTLLSEEGFRGASPHRPADYDNRIIWLSGLRIDILKVRPKDEAMLIEIRWDDFTVRKPVRWCGTIHLSPNPFQADAPSLSLKATLLLDQGHSPTYGTAISYDSVAKRFLFSDTTRFVVERGAYMRLAKGARILLRAGSQLILEEGSRLEGEGIIEVESGSQVRIAPGARCTCPIRYLRKPDSFLLKG